jgi:hypothetical protein
LQHWIAASVVVVVLLVDVVVVLLVVDVVLDVVVELVLVVVELVVVELVLVVVVELVVVELVVELVVVEVEVVVAPTGQRGRPGSPVQVHCLALHWLITLSTQLFEAWGPHAALISSLQAVLLSHLPALSAIAEEDRKTPTPSATTANNLTTAFLVIGEPPIAVPVLSRCPVLTSISAPSGRVPRFRHGCQEGFGTRQQINVARKNCEIQR